MTSSLMVASSIGQFETEREFRRQICKTGATCTHADSWSRAKEIYQYDLTKTEFL